MHCIKAFYARIRVNYSSEIASEMEEVDLEIKVLFKLDYKKRLELLQSLVQRLEAELTSVRS